MEKQIGSVGMRAQLAHLLIAGQMMGDLTPISIIPKKVMLKIPLTKKQKSKRAAAKRAGKARKNNR